MTMRRLMMAIKHKSSTLAERCSRGTAQKERSQRVALTPLFKSGERGIRTPGTVSGTQQFQCCTIGHSVTSPDCGSTPLQSKYRALQQHYQAG